ncbi:hypothetical protein [Candidatus Mesenet endosymbiont of Phosphuga atrata]|uniref:hypothetical protein n=1 Tax=Candidatus Mesenet endosymbiont of Phosphuga atrata TaxID=3066221 RepID=UPI0030CE83CB
MFSNIDAINYVNEGIKKNDIDKIREALANGNVIINDANQIEDTSLGLAIIRNCSIQLINFLLEKGAQIKTEYKFNKSYLHPSYSLIIHEYNHLHLAIAYKRVDIVNLLLKHGAAIVDNIPFLEILNNLNKKMELHSTCSFIKDNENRIIYAEIESYSSSILTTLNIAFGVGDPKIIHLILKHNKASFIKDIEDDGTVSHYEYGTQQEWQEYYTYHPYSDSYASNKRLNRKCYIHYIQNLDMGGAGCLNHYIISNNTEAILDKRIGLLKPYISTPSRIAYIIIQHALKSIQPEQSTESQDLYKINILDLITRCICYYQLKLEDITKSTYVLIQDGVVNQLQHNMKCCKRLKSKEIADIIYNYTEILFNCAKDISCSIAVCREEEEKIKKSISTTFSNTTIQDLSVQVDIWIGKHR